MPIESKLITRRIAAAQKAVEAQNFSARKHLLEYDDVMNKQRQAVYGMRSKLLYGRRTEGPYHSISSGELSASFIDTRASGGIAAAHLGSRRACGGCPDPVRCYGRRRQLGRIDAR